MVESTTALRKLVEMYRSGARKKVVQGGTSAGKTFSILPILIAHAQKNPLREISVVSESIPHLRRGCIKDFVKIMQMLGRYDDNKFNKGNLKYTFSNGSYIEFFSSDQPDKLRGSRRTDLYVNEANNVSFEAYTQLAIRTSGSIWIDYNPVMPFWAHTEVLSEEDSEQIILTYKDNEALSETIINELESKRVKAKKSKYWANWCKVYLDGETGNLEGACIPEWEQIDIIPKEARLVTAGLDFGYTNDPSSMINVYYYNGGYIFDEVFYKTQMRNSDIAKEIKSLNLPSSVYVYADQAEPKSIDELKYAGLRVEPCVKGRDSIVYGIELLNQNKIYVTANSKNLIKELQGYVWAKDKEGNTLNKPTGVDHAIDAMRYGLVTHLDNPTRGKYFVY